MTTNTEVLDDSAYALSVWDESEVEWVYYGRASNDLSLCRQVKHLFRIGYNKVMSVDKWDKSLIFDRNDFV